MGPHEPYWRTNTSFFPPPSNLRFQSETMSFDSHDGGQLFMSSASSNSRESRSWVRANNLATHHFMVSDGNGLYFSSPSDISSAQQWTPPAIQEISTDDYGTSRRDVVLRPFSFSPTMEGTSIAQGSRGSTSSRSDGSSDYDSLVKPHSSHHRNFTNRRCFMPKAIHPVVSLPSDTPGREYMSAPLSMTTDFDPRTPQREGLLLSSAVASLDLPETAEPIEHHLSNQPDSFKCGLCERFLSQRSPWSSRRIIKSGDMPTASVLSCRHVFHADCLEQTTSKSRKSDPLCPVCNKLEEESSPDQRLFTRLRSSFPRPKTFSGDGQQQKTSWGCVQAGDCVGGALHTPTKNTLLSLNRGRLKKSMSFMGNPNREFPGKLKKTEAFSPKLLMGSMDHSGAGSSKNLESLGLK